MITVSWPSNEECYIVEQDDEFIKDTEDLHDALEFALAVGEESAESVIIESIGPRP